jgi:hypothetical protein
MPKPATLQQAQGLLVAGIHQREKGLDAFRAVAVNDEVDQVGANLQRIVCRRIDDDLLDPPAVRTVAILREPDKAQHVLFGHGDVNSGQKLILWR